ncbi:transporter substrate-binding domain-containing protein [Desulfonema magnum]
MMLDNDRLDIVVNSVITGLGTLKKTGVRGITILNPPLEIHPVFHYLHKKNKALIPRLESVLKKMEKTGRIRKVQEKITETLKKRTFILE